MVHIYGTREIQIWTLLVYSRRGRCPNPHSPIVNERNKCKALIVVYHHQSLVPTEHFNYHSFKPLMLQPSMNWHLAFIKFSLHSNQSPLFRWIWHMSRTHDIFHSIYYVIEPHNWSYLNSTEFCYGVYAVTECDMRHFDS